MTPPKRGLAWVDRWPAKHQASGPLARGTSSQWTAPSGTPSQWPASPPDPNCKLAKNKPPHTKPQHTRPALWHQKNSSSRKCAKNTRTPAEFSKKINRAPTRFLLARLSQALEGGSRKRGGGGASNHHCLQALQI